MTTGAVAHEYLASGNQIVVCRRDGVGHIWRVTPDRGMDGSGHETVLKVGRREIAACFHESQTQEQCDPKQENNDSGYSAEHKCFHVFPGSSKGCSEALALNRVAVRLAFFDPRKGLKRSLRT